jgi:hypothetical protein
MAWRWRVVRWLFFLQGQNLSKRLDGWPKAWYRQLMVKRLRLPRLLFQYLALIFVTVVSVLDHYDDGLIWPALMLCLALGLTYQFWPWWCSRICSWPSVIHHSALLLQPVAIVLSFTSLCMRFRCSPIGAGQPGLPPWRQISLARLIRSLAGRAGAFIAVR